MKGIKIKSNIPMGGDKLTVGKYLKDISKIQKSVKQEKDKTPDELVVDNLRFVISVAKQYQGYGVELEDLINEGNLGLVVASKRFDSTQNVKFISYAVWYIKCYILSLLTKSGKKIKLSNTKVTEVHKINKLKSKLEQELEREPTVEEIADRFSKYSPKELLAMMESQKFHKNLDDKDSNSEFSLGDNVSNEDYDNFILNESRIDYKDKLNRLINKLSKRDKDLVLTYYGMHPVYKTLEEVREVYKIKYARAIMCIGIAIRRMRWRAKKDKFDI